MYVCVRVMCDVKAWNICLCRWDVRNEGVCYMCVCMTCEVKKWDICVCMFDLRKVDLDICLCMSDV
jgi:hypothetical protein